MKFLKDQKTWKDKSILNLKTGNPIPRFYYKNRKAPFVKLNSILSQKLAGYSLIEKDLRTASLWLAKIKDIHTREIPDNPGWHLNTEERDEDLIIKSLFVSALIFYAKCFASAEGRKTKLEKSNLPEEFHASHTDILMLRNNYGAHSGIERIEAVDIYLVLHPNKKNLDKSPILMRSLRQPEIIHDLPDSQYGFIELIEQARSFTLNKMALSMI